jgi:hypothetical protein
MPFPQSGAGEMDRAHEVRNRSLQNASAYAEWICVAALVAVGVSFRLRQFLFNRSLWLDEAKLANNILTTPLEQLLTTPLGMHQSAPPGFLLLDKIATALGGGGEYALRSVALAFGLAALVAAVWVGRLWWNHPLPRIAFVGFVAGVPELIYYSTELKQYAGDASVALVVMAAGWLALRDPDNRLCRTLFAILGAVAIWFSHPVILLLAGFGSVMILQRLTQRKVRDAAWIAGIGAGWIASFSLFMLLDARWLLHDSFLAAFWQNGFMPSLADPLGAFRWLGETLLGTVYLAFQSYGIAGAETSLEWFALPNLLLAGWCATGIVIAGFRYRRLAAVLGMTFLFILLAAALHFYPFRGRLALFFIPWVLAAGCFTLDFLSRHAIQRWLAAAAVLCIFGWMGWLSVPRVVTPDNHSDSRNAFRFIALHRMPGDLAVISSNSVAAFDYYKDAYGLADLAIIAILPIHTGFSDASPKVCAQSMRNRIWMIFTEPSPNRPNVLDRLKKIVPLLASYDVDEGGAYLFNFSNFSACKKY